MNAMLRLSRSSRAMIRVARCRFASSSAAPSSGAIGALAALDLGITGDDLATDAMHQAGDRLALRVELQP